MLIQNKKYQLNDVITFKLVTGEEVVARLNEETDTSYFLVKPLVIMPAGQQGIALAPVAFSLNPENPVELNKSAVAMHGRTVNELAGEYMKNTTGLTVVKAT